MRDRLIIGGGLSRSLVSARLRRPPAHTLHSTDSRFEDTRRSAGSGAENGERRTERRTGNGVSVLRSCSRFCASYERRTSNGPQVREREREREREHQDVLTCAVYILTRTRAHRFSPDPGCAPPPFEFEPAAPRSILSTSKCCAVRNTVLVPLPLPSPAYGHLSDSRLPTPDIRHPGPINDCLQDHKRNAVKYRDRRTSWTVVLAAACAQLCHQFEGRHPGSPLQNAYQSPQDASASVRSRTAAAAATTTSWTPDGAYVGYRQAGLAMS